MRPTESIRPNRRPTAVTSAVALLCCALGAGAAQAQSAAAPAAAAAASAPEGERKQLEKVVVTANKRVERLENVPMAISVLSAETIENSNTRSFEDVTNLSPALTITYGTTPANNGINMRGIGTSSIGIGVESDVAVVVDDVPLGMQFMAFKDLSDVERIEVIKGPQSTLFGKASIAGAVNITTKPVNGPLRGNASFQYTSDSERRVRVSYGGDITEQLGFRLSASDTNFAGNVNNLTYGNKINGSKGRTFMGKLSWRPTDKLEVEFSPRYNRTETSCCVLVPTSLTPLQGALLSNIKELPATNLLAGIDIGPYNRSVRNDTVTGMNSTDTGAGLRILYDFGPVLLTSVTSAEHYTADDLRDQDFVDVPTLMYYPLANGQPAGVKQGYLQSGTYDIQSRTQELRLTSNEAGKLRWVGGFFWAQNVIDRTFVRGYNGIALTTPSAYTGNTYNRNTAVFGQASYELAPGTTALAGLRYNHQNSGYVMDMGAPPPGAFVVTSHFESRGNAENSTTGKLSLQQQFTPGLMGYVMGATGYKGKAYDLTSGLNAQTAAQQPVASESGKTFEVGLKGNFLDNRMTLNVAAFKSTFSDYQQNSGSYLPGTTTYVTRLNSIGGVQTHGIEADLAALVSPGLLVNASLAYTIATVTDWKNAPCYNVAGSPNGGFNLECLRANPAFGGTNTQDVSGKPMPNAPRIKGTLGGRYDFKLNGLSFNGFMTANVRFQSKVLTNINQDPTLNVGGYGITNVRFGIKDKAGVYELSFLVNNLFDRQYANTGFSGYGSWSSRSPNPSVTVTNTTWTPARDAWRYGAVRLDVKF